VIFLYIGVSSIYKPLALSCVGTVIIDPRLGGPRAAGLVFFFFLFVWAPGGGEFGMRDWSSQKRKKNGTGRRGTRSWTPS